MATERTTEPDERYTRAAGNPVVCGDCGAVVADVAAHDGWHNHIESHLAPELWASMVPGALRP